MNFNSPKTARPQQGRDETSSRAWDLLEKGIFRVDWTTTNGHVTEMVAIDHSTIAHTRSGTPQDGTVFSGVASWRVDTGDSDDSISVQFGSALPLVTIAGGEQGFVDELTVLRATPGDVISVGVAIVTDGTSTVNFSEIERVVVDAGDFNFDGMVGGSDIDALVAAIAAGDNPPALELTGDRRVDTDDLQSWLALAGAANLPSGNSYLVGDANLDGIVDGSDFNAWNANKFQPTAAWTAGDFNADGNVDGSDFNLWNAHKFQSAQRSAPPRTRAPTPSTNCSTACSRCEDSPCGSHRCDGVPVG